MKIRLYGYCINGVLSTSNLSVNKEDARQWAAQAHYDNYYRDKIELVSVNVDLKKLVSIKPITEKFTRKKIKKKPKEKTLKRVKLRSGTVPEKRRNIVNRKTLKL